MSNQISKDSLSFIGSKIKIGDLKPGTKPRKARKIVLPLKKIQPKKNEKTEFNYSMGHREGYTRIVGPDSISTHVKPIITLGDLTGSSNYLDGEVGSSSQGKRGDCYFLASINSIRNTADGQAILKKNIRENADGSITVTLPGAVAIRNQYLKDGKANGCEVTGVYHITQEAIQKAIANAGKSYSKGDLEVIALEIAMENYRAEMVATKRNLGISGNESYTAEWATNHLDDRDYLSSGNSYDATFILTGQKSDVYTCTDSKYQNVKLYKSGEYGFITREEMERRESFGMRRADFTTKGMSEVTHVTTKESDFQRMLNKYQGHEDEFSLTFNVRVAKKGKDGITKAGDGHALTVVKITKTTVYVANPWYPDKIEPIPRAEFEKMATGFSATPMTKASVNGNYSKNAFDDLSNGVDSQEAEALREAMNRLISHNKPGKIQQPISNINPKKINKYIAAYNKTKHSEPLNARILLRSLNNASKMNLSKEQSDFINRLITQMSSDEKIKISDKDVKILQSLLNRKS